MNFKFVKVALAWGVVTGLCLPLSFGGGAISFTTGKAWALSSESVPLTSNIFVEIAKKQNPAVVSVRVKAKKTNHPSAPPGSPQNPKDQFRDFYDKFFRGQRPPNQQPPQGGMGSGFIIDPEGYVLTNNHVVAGGGELLVSLENDKEYAATLVGADPKTDVALIKISRDNGDSEPFPHLEMGDSDGLEVGEWVVAIGSPFGLTHTVTVGVVSAKSRNINAGPYDEFIQTDASINPGNSGGPLINIRGEVIGVNTAIISGPSGGGNVGIGFAIPINLVKTIYRDLREKGTVTRGWLGVMIQKITPELAKAFELKDSDGALVGDVIPDGPAAAAGIKRGDVIVKFNGQEVKDMEQLPKIVAQTQPETEVDVEVIRAGKMEKLQVRIAILKDPEQQVLAKADPLGMQVQDITPELAQSLKLDTTEGVLVSDVTAGQPAAESGVKRGDVITEIDRSPVRNTGDYKRLTSNIRQGRSALFLVRRGGSTIFIAVKVK